MTNKSATGTGNDSYPAVLPGHLQALARFLDESIRLPGGYRIGWDGLIGLIPGVGDVAGLLVSSYIVAGAARLGVAKSVLLRMCANVAIETVIGAIPVVGDVFDFVYKANLRNVALLEKHGYASKRVERGSTAWLLVLGVVLLLVVSAVVYAMYRLIGGLAALI